MNTLKKKKKNILFVIFYLAVILAGVNAYFIGKNGINPEESLFFQFAGLISVLLLAFGCFYEIYFGKSNISK